MHRLDLSLTDPAENLAVDEAMLELIDQATGEPLEVLRLWNFESPVVVIGRASKIAEEVNQEFCEASNIPILRRTSGGTAVTAGPGCFMYSLVLCLRQRPHLRNVDIAHRYVMETIREALSVHVGEIQFQGTCDLTWRARKFSGNSLRVGRDAILYHGTILFDYPLDLIGSSLGIPPRQPEYRGDRTHMDFVTNLPASESQIKDAISRAFNANKVLTKWPRERTMELAREKYSTDEWNLRR